jgi:hypothetical protein
MVRWRRHFCYMLLFGCKLKFFVFPPRICDCVFLILTFRAPHFISPHKSSGLESIIRHPSSVSLRQRQLLAWLCSAQSHLEMGESSIGFEPKNRRDSVFGISKVTLRLLLLRTAIKKWRCINLEEILSRRPHREVSKGVQPHFDFTNYKIALAIPTCRKFLSAPEV